MASAERKTVLLVDDEEPFLLSLLDALHPAERHLRVLTALDGKQALELVGRFAVHLVVTDLKMSGLDGFGLLAALKQDYNQVRVIVMTAYNSPAIESALLPFAPFALFEKPIDPDELVKAILQAVKPVERVFFPGGALASLLAIPFLFVGLMAPDNEQLTKNKQVPDSWRENRTTVAPTKSEDRRTARCSDPRA